MDDDTTDAAQHQQQLEECRRMEEGWDWWPSYYDSVLARQKAEQAQLKALSWALDRIFDEN